MAETWKMFRFNRDSTYPIVIIAENGLGVDLMWVVGRNDPSVLLELISVLQDQII
jgi:hypothetical protein